MIRKLCIMLTLLVFISVLQHGHTQTTEQKFQYVLDSIYQINTEATGVIIHVESPDRHISWTSAVGHAERGQQRKLDPQQPVLIASNTKTYVAAAILKLVEQGLLQLDQPVAGIIMPETQKLLEQNKYNVNQITIRQLLSHTSGIRDYVNDSYFNFVNDHPDYKWSRKEQIALAMKTGGPLAEPGKEFKYADVNYLLLTEIIEGKTGKPFYDAIRELLNFDKLGLKQTWFDKLEPKPSSLPLAHQYWDKRQWDSYKLDPSWDLYGGGGINATASDLAMFFQYLFEGKIIANRELLVEMYTPVLPESLSNYCLGIRKIAFSGHTACYHGGFWGTDVMYLPGQNTTIAVFTLEKDHRDINHVISDRILNILIAGESAGK